MFDRTGPGPRPSGPSRSVGSGDQPVFIHDRPRVAALLLALAWLVVAVAGAVALQGLAPSWSGTARALAVSIVLAVGVAVLLSCLRWWGPAGFNRPRQWHDLRLLGLPAVLVVIPVVTGFKAVTPGLLAMILLGEALTGFMEEAYFRGIILRILRSTGALPAVLLSSVLFGAVHLGNVFFRDSAALVVAQAVGAFSFGVGYAALRLRTGTLWPLIVLHMLSNAFAVLGALPAIPILVGQDVVLLIYGLALVRSLRSTGREAAEVDAPEAPAEPPAQLPPQRQPSPRRAAQPPVGS